MSSEFLDRLNSSSNYDFIVEFNESSNTPMDEEIFEQIHEKIEEYLGKYQFLGGISVFDSDGVQIITISKNQKVNEDFHTTSTIIKEMNTKIFFGELPNKTIKDGLGHLKFNYFQIFFAKIGEHALSFFIIDEAEELTSKLNIVVDQITKIIENKSKQLEDQSSKSSQSAPSPNISSSSTAPSPGLSNTNDSSTTSGTVNNEKNTSYNSPETNMSTNDKTNKVNKKTKKVKSKDDLKSSLQDKLKNIDDN